MKPGAKKSPERDRLDFIAEACRILERAKLEKVIWFRCQACGASACTVKLGPGDRRAACSCGIKFFEKYPTR